MPCLAYSLQGYGDGSTPMGFCTKCIYSSIDQLRLGWSRALPPVDWALFNGSSTVTLPALTDAAAFRDLGVVQIRLSNPTEPGVPGGRANTIYLSYRVKKAQDDALPDKYSQATSVHASNGDSWILAWPKTGQAYVNTANKMVIRQDSGDANQARVTICKWVTAQRDCGQFATFVRSSISAASAGEEGPVDREAYYGKHTWHPAGAGAGVNGSAADAPHGLVEGVPLSSSSEPASAAVADSAAAAALSDVAPATGVEPGPTAAVAEAPTGPAGVLVEDTAVGAAGGAAADGAAAAAGPPAEQP